MSRTTYVVSYLYLFHRFLAFLLLVGIQLRFPFKDLTLFGGGKIFWIRHDSPGNEKWNEWQMFLRMQQSRNNANRSCSFTFRKFFFPIFWKCNFLSADDFLPPFTSPFGRNAGSGATIAAKESGKFQIETINFLLFYRWKNGFLKFSS